MQHIVAFLDALHDAAQIGWFTNHNEFEVPYLPLYLPFLNHIGEFFPLGDAVYMTGNHMPLLQAMEQACGDTQGAIFPDEKTLLVMLMRSCGQTPADGRIH